MHFKGLAQRVVAADVDGRAELVERLRAAGCADVRALGGGWGARHADSAGPADADLIWCRITPDDQEVIRLLRWILDSGFGGHLVLTMGDGCRLPTEAIRMLHRARMSVLAAVDWPPRDEELQLVQQRLAMASGARVRDTGLRGTREARLVAAAR
jgi:hypothetical protein